MRLGGLSVAPMILRLLPVPLGLAGIAAALLTVPTADAGRPGRPRLPDLQQEAPSRIAVVRSQPPAAAEYRLGFGSAVSNVGRGPLILDVPRSADSRTMVADQVLEFAGAPRGRVPRVGRLRYVVSPDHRHWH